MYTHFTFLSGLSSPEGQADDIVNFKYDHNGIDVGYTNFFSDALTWRFLGVESPSRTVSFIFLFVKEIGQHVHLLELITQSYFSIPHKDRHQNPVEIP